MKPVAGMTLADVRCLRVDTLVFTAAVVHRTFVNVWKQQEASTHKSAKTQAGTAFVTRNQGRIKASTGPGAVPNAGPL